MGAAFVLFLFIVFAYSAVCYKSSKLFENVRGRERKDSLGHDFKKVIKMHKRIARLVLTDFMCWVPLCIISFCSLAGVSTPSWVYSFTVVVLLPINSALNPLLYSDVISNIFMRVKKRCGKSFETNESIHSYTPHNANASPTSSPIIKARSFKPNEDAKTLTSELNKEFNEQSLSKRIQKLVIGKRRRKSKRQRQSSNNCTKSNVSYSKETITSYISTAPSHLKIESTV